MSIYNKGGGVLIVRSDLIGTTPSRCLTPLALRCCPSLGAARRRSAARIQDFELARRRLCPFGSRSPVHSTPKIKGLSSFIFIFFTTLFPPFKKNKKQKTNSSHLASISWACLGKATWKTWWPMAAVRIAPLLGTRTPNMSGQRTPAAPLTIWR